MPNLNGNLTTSDEREKVLEALNHHADACLVEANGLKPIDGIKTYHVDWQRTFAAGVGLEAQICIHWKLRAEHVGQGRVDVSLEPGGPLVTRRTGFKATGRIVTLDVTTTGAVAIKTGGGAAEVVECDYKRWKSQWDTLGALAQIGVRAVGRPIIDPAERRFFLPPED